MNLAFSEDLQARPRPATQAPVLLTIRQFAEKHPAFSQGAIRQLILNTKTHKTSRGTIHANGLAVAILRLGRKVLIDEARFFEWLSRQQHQTTLFDSEEV